METITISKENFDALLNLARTAVESLEILKIK